MLVGVAQSVAVRVEVLEIRGAVVVDVGARQSRTRRAVVLQRIRETVTVAVVILVVGEPVAIEVFGAVKPVDDAVAIGVGHVLGVKAGAGVDGHRVRDHVGAAVRGRRVTSGVGEAARVGGWCAGVIGRRVAGTLGGVVLVAAAGVGAVAA